MIRNHPLLPAHTPVHGLVIDPHTGALELVVDGYNELRQRAPNAVPAAGEGSPAGAVEGPGAGAQPVPTTVTPLKHSASLSAKLRIGKPFESPPRARPDSPGSRNRLVDVTMQGMYTTG